MNSDCRIKRRDFAAVAATVIGGGLGLARAQVAEGFISANERPTIGVVGCGLRWDKRVMVPNANYGLGKQFQVWRYRRGV